MKKCYTITTLYSSYYGDDKQNWVTCFASLTEAVDEILWELGHRGNLHWIEETDKDKFHNFDFFIGDGYYFQDEADTLQFLLTKEEAVKRFQVLGVPIACGDYTLVLNEV